MPLCGRTILLSKLLKPKFDPKSFSSFISETMDVVGDIKFEGVLRVDGKVKGLLSSPNDDLQEHGIVIEKTGRVECKTLKTGHLVVGGELEADEVIVTSFLHVKSTAKIRNCKFTCDRFQVDDGADISGCSFDKFPRGIPGTNGE